MLPQLQAIEDKALQLLLQEPEDQRKHLLGYADDQLEKVGLNPHLSNEENLNQACHDLFGSNPLLPDWLRARGIGVENVLHAESFVDLVDRLTPGYQDA